MTKLATQKNTHDSLNLSQNANSDQESVTLAKAKKPLSPMFEQYHEIKAQHPECLLFFRMGDFYELFYDDAVQASAALDITLTKRGKTEDETIPMCGVPCHASDVYLSRLIRKGYRVAVCEQVESPEEAKKRKGKTLVRRDVVRIVTPGTLTEDNLLQAASHNFLLAAVAQKKDVGCAWVDISTGDFYVETVPFDKFSAQLAKLQPKEIVLSHGFMKSSDLFDVFDEWKKEITPQPPSRFDYENGRKRLESAFDVKSLEAYGSFSRTDIMAAGALLEYVNLTQKGSIPRLTPPQKVNRDGFMDIDVATRKNLELVRTLQGEYQGSLLQTIDRTVTGPGTRKLFAWISAPLTNPTHINQRLCIVEFFFKNPNFRKTLRTLLKQCADMERILSRLSVLRGGPRDLVSLATSLIQAKEIVHLIEKQDLSDLPAGFKKKILPVAKFEGLLKSLQDALTLDEQVPLQARDGGFIRPGYLDDLDEARKLRDEGKTIIAQLQMKYAAEYDIPSLKIKFNNMLGYHIEVTKTHANKVPEQFIHRQSMLNAARYTTPDLSEMEQKIQQSSEQALTLELHLYEKLVAQILENTNALVALADLLSILDVTTSLAQIADEQDFAKPVVDDSLTFDIKGGAHPVVAAVLQRDNEKEFIRNDCDLNPVNRLWLMTGPNMAGKSTFLRQNALIAILAQMGSFVPAKSAHIGIVDRVFSRVGASDNLAKGQSTFMVEMVETASILHQATERSLVILDEIGRGTATFDGLSIASATLEHLHEANQCRTLFATHYHELTTIHEKLKHIAFHTIQVKEWQEKIVFMHKVIKGCADKSYGIHVAKIAGLPQPVIARAEAILETLESGKASKHMAAVSQMMSEQLPLFQVQPEPTAPTIPEEHQDVLDTLENLDINTMTPIEALTALNELKKKIG